MTYVELAAGLVLLVVGGDLLVRGAVGVAKHFGVSPLLIGLTLVGFGTSTPELVTSVQAALVGSPGITIGNVVGSNIANILLILGIAALVHPLTTSRDALIRDGGVMLLASLACLAIVLYGNAERAVGGLLFASLVGYIIFTYLRERVVHDASAALHEAEAAIWDPAPTRIVLASFFAVGGLILTVVGARLLVGGAIDLARAAGVSETVVGLTIVAVGTSLPELVTSVMAAIRRQSDVAFGNIIGSSIYNILGILGITALVKPIEVPPQIASLDIWVMLTATVVLVFFSFSGLRLNRWEGAALLTAYVFYVGYLVSVAA